MTAPSRLVAGRYRLREQIGLGGMGAVWLALDERLDREVAIKQVLPPVDTDPSAARKQRERALREGRIAARLSHPHAISVYDVAMEDDQPWLVMEYLPSRSLATVLAEDGVLRVDQTAQIGAQVADALAATHAAGIVHRDVKPANILIGRGGRIEGLVKITDFGISHASGDVTLTQTGQVTGTPAFLAPEVARGVEPGPAADVFSLGATLYACLEGQPPFGMGDNALQQLHRVAAGTIEPPKRSGALTRPLLRMLAADPAERPDMEDVRDELAALAAGRDGDITTVLAAPTDISSPGLNVPEATPTSHFDRADSATPSAEVPAPPAPEAPAPVWPDVAPPVIPPRPAADPAAAAALQASSEVAPERGTALAATGTPPPSRPSAPARTGDAEGRRRRQIPPLGWVAAAVVAVLASVVVFWSLVLNDDPGTGTASPRSTTPTTSATPDTDTASPGPTTPTTSGTTVTASPGSTAPTTSAPVAATTAPTTPTTSAPAAPTTIPPTPTTIPPTPTTPPSEDTAGGVGDATIQADSVEQYLDQYHELVVDDPAAAYAQAGPTLQRSISLAGFESFWGRFDDVSISDVQVQEGGDSALAVLELSYPDGTRQIEQHRFDINDEDGRLVLDRDSFVDMIRSRS